ncbi:MAG: efflux RND transporter permease subunit [Prolixibacteraceae bacterium]|nr:efflux RND transporter permease subunit [Prolixibacteraceae bacterium]
MKKLTEFSVKYPVTILMVVLAVLLLGYISFDKLGMDLFPDLKSPRIFIEVTSGERPPEEMEKQFVENIEALVIRQSDVIKVSSITKVGASQITVEYSWKKDMDEAFLDLQKALNSYSQNSNIDELFITQHDPNTAPVMLIALTHNEITDMNEVRKVAENYIRNELVRLEGVAEVELSGQEESEVIINTDLYRLQAQNLSLSDLSSRIQSFNQSVSGGSISELGLQYIVKGVSLLRDIGDFENLIVGYKPVQTAASGTTASESAPIFLKDVATVLLRNKEPDNIVHLNGQRCIGLSVFKETRYNTVNAVNQINEALTKINKALPGYQLTVISNQGTFISDAVGEVKNTLLLGIVLAVFIIFIFLRRIGTTLIVSLSIPISIIATFNMMYFSNLTLNIMTLGGLALGAGMLVDNAIVVIENIFRIHSNKTSVADAAVRGTSEVSGAIIASTLTTIVVFLPIVYLHGASGELFKDQAWTVAFSLISSLFVAIFFIPMLYNMFYKNKPAPTKRMQEGVNKYGKILGKILNAKWIIIIISFIIMGFAFLLIPKIGSEFMPQTETNEFTVNLKLAEGTKLGRTASMVESLESVIADYLGDNVDKIYSHIGPSTGTGNQSSIFQGENTAQIRIILKKDSSISSESVAASIDKLTSGIPNLEVSFSKEETALQSILGTEEAPVIIEIKGIEMDEIERISIDVKEKISTVAGLYNIQTSIEDGAPEIEIVLDRVRAGMYGIDINSVISQLQSQLQGQSAGEFEKGGEMSAIVIKLPEAQLSDLPNMTITSGAQVYRLVEIAEMREGVSPKEIYRRNQNRIGKVTAQLQPGLSLQHVAEDIRQATSTISLEPDYSIYVTGDEEKRQESMSSLGFALILSVILVYMVMASQFESLLQPLTVIFTIPFALVGSIFTFYIFGRSFNMMAFIGIIMLAGIAVNNAIILIDRINQLRRDGADRRTAIIAAGEQRIRPILMTSLTTILALLPLTFGFGESEALRSPMAFAVIGGLITSTIMTLAVIPCVYDVFDRMRAAFSRNEGNELEEQYS